MGWRGVSVLLFLAVLGAADVRGNAVGAVVEEMPAEAVFGAYDRLPRELRAWLQEAVCAWAPQDILVLWNNTSAVSPIRAQRIALALRVLEDAQRDEIETFARSRAETDGEGTIQR
jgi:hypothetical protein